MRPHENPRKPQILSIRDPLKLSPKTFFQKPKLQIPIQNPATVALDLPPPTQIHPTLLIYAVPESKPCIIPP